MGIMNKNSTEQQNDFLKAVSITPLLMYNQQLVVIDEECNHDESKNVNLKMLRLLNTEKIQVID